MYSIEKIQKKKKNYRSLILNPFCCVVFPFEVTELRYFRFKKSFVMI
jgi:hypothetical protein